MRLAHKGKFGMTKRFAGYISSCVAVRRDRLSSRHVRYLERHLEFTVPGNDQVYKCYDDETDDTHYYIPRGILLDDKFPELPELSDQRVLAPVAIPDSKIKLRSDQVMPGKRLRKAGGGVLHAPTGSGKTTVMLWLIGKLKQRTLVVVHTNDLLQQWQDRCLAELGIEAGVFGGGQWNEREITIATVQTLARYDMNRADFTQRYGLVILDEAHRAPANSFAKVLQAMQARYLYGCTATPTRADGMHPLMHAIIGPTVAYIKESGLVDKGKLIQPSVYMVPTGFTSEYGEKLSKRRKKPLNMHARNRLYQSLSKDLVKSKKRNKLIRNIILMHKDESVLVLSDRISHLQNIYDLVLEADWTINCHLLTGSVGAQERHDMLNEMRSGKANVILATKIADEGLDVPVLNVLVLAYPGKAVERLTQRIGRIMRTFEGKESARIYDLVDERIPTFHRHAKVRYKFYIDKGMKVRGWKPLGRK